MNNKDLFPQEFLEGLSIPELTLLQHDLRKLPEDKPYLDQVLGEFARRIEVQDREARQRFSQPYDRVVDSDGSQH